jgi:DNA-binding response OmpR family regulator
MEELIVRIYSLLERKIQNNFETKIAIGSYFFDAIKQTLIHHTRTIALTHRESALLEILIMNKDDVLDRSIILQTIWGNDDFFNGRSLDVFISKLRKKLADDDVIQIINVRGFGYKITY